MNDQIFWEKVSFNPSIRFLEDSQIGIYDDVGNRIKCCLCKKNDAVQSLIGKSVQAHYCKKCM